jgi:hypothetical protein
MTWTIVIVWNVVTARISSKVPSMSWLKDKKLAMHCFREGPLWTRRSRTHWHVLSWDLEQGAANRGREIRSYPQAHLGPNCGGASSTQLNLQFEQSFQVFRVEFFFQPLHCRHLPLRAVHGVWIFG